MYEKELGLMEQLYEFIERSLDDGQVSRNESAVLKERLAESGLNKRERGLLRHKIYALVSEKIHDPRDRELLGWLEDIPKALDSVYSAKERRFESLFFPSDSSFRQFLSVLKEAKQSLDICVFTITDNRVVSVLRDLKAAGVQIRIISDNDKAMDRGSDVYELARDDVPVRFDDTSNHMHHKFAILDNKLLLNGSYNWTRSANLYNQENLIITNEPELLQSFRQEFEKLWEKFG